jgi:hypothetical protein
MYIYITMIQAIFKRIPYPLNIKNISAVFTDIEEAFWKHFRAQYNFRGIKHNFASVYPKQSRLIQNDIWLMKK